MEASIKSKYKNIGKYIFYLIIIFLFVFIFLVAYSISSVKDQEYDTLQLSIAWRQRTLIQRYYNKLLVPQKSYKLKNKDLRKILLRSVDALIYGGKVGLIVDEKGEDSSHKITLPVCFSGEARNKLIEQKQLLEKLFLLSDQLDSLKGSSDLYKSKLDEIGTVVYALNNNTNHVITLFTNQREIKNKKFVAISTAVSAFALLLIVLLAKQIYDINKNLIHENKERLIMEQKLSASNKELENFAFAASHDMQEPLRQIISFGELIERKYKDTVDEKTSGFLKIIVDSAYRMRAMIDDILEMSRVSTKEYTLQEVDLNKVVNGVISDLDHIIKNKNASVVVDKLPIVLVDELQIRQLFQNLISNSIKYSRKEVSPLIKINAKELTNGKVDIVLSDNGIGFDDKDSERIFMMFQRLHTQEEYEGTGIGLAICKKIVERHGGNIVASGKKNEGSIFTITLPAGVG